MRIRVNEEDGTITLGDTVISAGILREIVDPDRRVLFRFEKRGTEIIAIAYSEYQVLWLDKPEPEEELKTGIGAEFGDSEKLL